LSGKEVIAQSNNQNTAGFYEKQINMDNLATGMYILSINIDGKFDAVKIIKL
jgi:hypothetical protein